MAIITMGVILIEKVGAPLDTPTLIFGNRARRY